MAQQGAHRRCGAGLRRGRPAGRHAPGERQHGPLAASFTPLTPENTSKAPKLEIQYKQVEEKKEPGLKEKITETLKDPENASYLPYIGGVFALLALVAGVVLYRRRHSPNLLDTTPDWRLSAPYGAGVSRLVKYLEGKESEKEKTLF